MTPPPAVPRRPGTRASTSPSGSRSPNSSPWRPCRPWPGRAPVVSRKEPGPPRTTVGTDPCGPRPCARTCPQQPDAQPSKDPSAASPTRPEGSWCPSNGPGSVDRHRGGHGRHRPTDPRTPTEPVRSSSPPTRRIPEGGVASRHSGDGSGTATRPDTGIEKPGPGTSSPETRLPELVRRCSYPLIRLVRSIARNGSPDLRFFHPSLRDCLVM